MRLFTKIESFNFHTIFDNYNQFTAPDAFSFSLCNYFIVLQFSKNDFYTHFEFYQCVLLRLYEKIGFEWLDNDFYSFSFIHLFFALNVFLSIFIPLRFLHFQFYKIFRIKQKILNLNHNSPWALVFFSKVSNKIE